MDIDKLRADTPATVNKIHFNNAGASFSPIPVQEAVNRYLAEESMAGGYEWAAQEAVALSAVYDQVAMLIQAKATNIALVESATVAWTRAYYSLPWQSGDEIITCSSEYASNYLAFLQLQKKYAIKIVVAPTDDLGRVDPAALEGCITPRTRLIAITHMPTNGGLVNPAEAIGQVAARHGIWYLLDACQSVGQYPLEVSKLKCDFLSATGRKYLRAPRGTGFLYASDRALAEIEPHVVDLHSAEWVAPGAYELRADAKRFETWECNPALRLGLGAAARYAVQLGIDRIWKRVQQLGSYLREHAGKVPGVTCRDLGREQSGIVSLDFAHGKAEDIKNALLKQGVNTSLIVPSGTRLDMEDRGLGNMLRVSVHYYNTHEEIDRFIELLEGHLRGH